MKDPLLNSENGSYGKDSSPFNKRAFEPSSTPEKKLFEKRKEGLTRGELRAELKKVPLNKVGGLNEKGRLAVEMEMDKKRYGENIDIKDLDKHIKNLKKQELTGPTMQERLEAKHKKTLLENLRNKKI